MKFDIVHKYLTIAFGHIGCVLAKWPLHFLVLVIIICGALSGGVALLDFGKKHDIEQLYAPENSEALDEKARMRRIFKEDENGLFNVVRSSEIGELCSVVVESNTNDSNIFKRETIEDILKIYKTIKDAKTGEYGWKDVCAKWKTDCVVNAYLETLLNMNAANFGPVSYPAHMKPIPNLPPGQGLPLPMADIFGSCNVINGTIVSSEAFQMLFYLRKNVTYTRDWEKEMLNIVENLTKYYPNFKIQRYCSLSIPEEMLKNTEHMIPKFCIVIGAVAILCIIANLSTDIVVAKPYLGLAALITSILSALSAFGLIGYCNVMFTDLSFLSVFLVIGIGVQDSFVITTAWRRTINEQSVQERMMKTMEEAGVAITLTSVTNVVATAIGAISPFLAVRILCLYTAVGLLFAYILQILFFCPCLVLAGRLENENRNSITCQISDNYKDPSLEGETPSGIMIFMRDQYSRILLSKPSMVVVTIVFMAYLALAIYGSIEKIKEGLDAERVVSDNSYVASYYQSLREHYSNYTHPVAIVFDKPLPYWNQSVYNRIEELLNRFETNEYFNGANVTISWTRFLKLGLAAQGLEWPNSEASLYIQLQFMLNSATAKPILDVVPLNLDIQFKPESGAISASRMFVISKGVLNGTARKEFMQVSRDIVADFKDLNVFVYSNIFPLAEQWAIVGRVALQNMGIAAGVMLVFSLLFIPNLTVSIIVTLSIGSICVGVIGFMSWWNVYMDIVATVGGVMCVGFAVDFSAHLAFAYVTNHSNKSKAASALYAVGQAVILGCLSTILCVIPLATSSTYVLRSFFKVMLLVALFGAFHALVVLPVILSMAEIIKHKEGNAGVNRTDDLKLKKQEEVKIKFEIQDKKAGEDNLGMEKES
ncbi:DgyrCDS12678 [Dimorphilus gyrociliatus]|uniref:DgyrCDS12678 n=1 Tax=Dimorphilus gyrociliatus TaxID=2664684 RepID=A0A7I8W826_9ANNE|nr:DgyrCDS12678 [Dimorphilus gyrociliatus]